MLIIGASKIQAEYIWTGEAWRWQEKSDSSPSQTGFSSPSGGVDSSVEEGSGSDNEAWDINDDYDLNKDITTGDINHNQDIQYLIQYNQDEVANCITDAGPESTPITKIINEFLEALLLL